MKIYVLDANAIIRYMLLWNDWERVKALLEKARKKEVQLLMSVVNWGEVIYTMAKRIGLERAISDLKALRSVIQTVIVEEETAAEAATLKHGYKIGYGDSFAAALAMERNATLVTADPEFAKLGKRLKLMALERYGN